MARKKKVLFVEDNEGLLEIVTTTLKKEFDVVGVNSGESAWDHIKVSKVDCIVMDLDLPRMSGLDLLEKIRKSGNKTDVIVATGMSCCFGAEQCADYAVSGYVTKPYTPQEIIKKIHSLAPPSSMNAPSIKGSHPAIRRAEAYIHKNYHDKITLNSLTLTSSLSTDYQAKLFKKETGTSFMQYLNRFRVEKATELLADLSLSIYDIGKQCGFNSQQHFYTQFKKYTGQTPGEHRVIGVSDLLKCQEMPRR